MEPANIDWKSIESEFVVDDLYEDIKAPKWIDFSANSSDKSFIDDEAWFCRQDCNHPKSVEDLLQLKLGSKVERSTAVLETQPMGNPNRRDASLKRRPGLVRPLLSSNKGTKSDKFVVEDGENVNPNLYPPLSHQYNSMKSVIESSTQKKKKNTNNKMKEAGKGPQQKQLKATLSARNLFGGQGIVNQITDFCSELKRLATRAKESEPLLESRGEICGVALDKSNVMEKERQVKMRSKKEAEDTENKPQNPLFVDLKEIKKKNNKDASSSQIQTCPPSPQCFSAGRSPTDTRIPPLKLASKSRLQVRGILQELDLENKELNKEDHNNTTNIEKGRTEGKPASPIVLKREAPPTLDVFWFLKPCTRLST